MKTKGIKKLTQKQSSFIDEYLVDFNGAAAARRAKYATKGARVRAYELLNTPHIQAEIVRRVKEMADKRPNALKKEHVYDLLCKMANTNITDFLSFKTDLVPVNVEMPDGENKVVAERRHVVELKDSSEIDGELIKSIKLRADGTLEFVLHDKAKAVENLGRYYAMFTDVVKDETQTLEDYYRDMAPAEREQAKRKIMERLNANGNGKHK